MSAASDCVVRSCLSPCSKDADAYTTLSLPSYLRRPGGPDFYFSIVNNVKNHGPGGQKNYNLPKEADPAFAKVTAGFDVLEKVHTLPTKTGGWEALLTPVIIRKMKLRD